MTGRADAGSFVDPADADADDDPQRRLVPLTGIPKPRGFG